MIKEKEKILLTFPKKKKKYHIYFYYIIFSHLMELMVDGIYSINI